MIGIFLVVVLFCAVTQVQSENESTGAGSLFDISNISRRVVNGQSAYMGQFPYQALLNLTDPLNQSYVCGGSIISQNWIITAAHCLEEIVSVDIHVGIINRSPLTSEWTTKVEKSNFIIHENYDDIEVTNDIALIRLDSKIPENQFVKSISLPTRADANEDLVGRTANVSGFGRYADKSKNSSSPILMWVELPIVDNSFCELLNPPERLAESKICVGSKDGMSPCFGDSGGPLAILRSDGTPVLIGIVSHGYSVFCELGHPGVFTDVHSFLDWIETSKMVKIFLVIVVLCAVTQAQMETTGTGSLFDIPNISRRVVNGQSAYLGQFPYQALLNLTNSLNQSFTCGGSIISHNWILTAAHCLEEIVSVDIYVGIVNRSPITYEWKTKVEKSNFIIHEEYDTISLTNDIALIRLDSKIPENQNVSPISLPTRAEANEDLVGKAANVSGFGRDSDKSKESSPTLMWIELSIVANSFCEKANPKIPERQFESKICVGSKDGMSSCNGDSGGPLAILRSDETPVLIGIVSYGYFYFCEENVPEVYTNVHSFLDWIEGKSGIQIS
ncbi:unnamed protein product [Diamesa hyperborea]